MPDLAAGHPLIRLPRRHAQEGVPAGQADELVGQQFRGADADRDSRISHAEFVAYCHGAGASRARRELRQGLGPAAERASS